VAPDPVKLPVTLKDGTVVTDDVLKDLVAEAERGYDPERLRAHPIRSGRPSLSRTGVSPRVQFRAPADVYAEARRRARAEGQPLSAVLRRLLAEYARGHAGP
ncbi:MAG: hypothetical protein ACREQ5_10065, partial [Candidatus Dormibacteria bacterium]